jgi:hypothetical protein
MNKEIKDDCDYAFFLLRLLLVCHLNCLYRKTCFMMSLKLGESGLEIWCIVVENILFIVPFKFNDPVRAVKSTSINPSSHHLPNHQPTHPKLFVFQFFKLLEKI